MRDMIVVCGPTASGKTALSLELARELRGEIVCADSMQVYRGLDIGTAKPTPEERALVPHHMIDLLDPREPYSAAAYQRDARRCVEGIRARGALPIVVGGTGLFIDALTCHMTFGEVRGEAEVRARWAAYERENGAVALHEELRRLDPEAAARLHPNDTRRVMRALEVWTLTGGAPARASYRDQPAYDAGFVALRWERSVLYARVDARVDQMMEQGLLEEARRVFDMRLPDDATARQGIGYKEFFPYFEGRAPLEGCVETLKRATRRYAKRQETWFRGHPRVRWIEPERLWPCASGSGVKSYQGDGLSSSVQTILNLL